jgi:hypothetical protein
MKTYLLKKFNNKPEIRYLYPICIPKKQNPYEHCYSEGVLVPGGGIEPPRPLLITGF